MKNPDPTKYAMDVEGNFILLPRQCPKCKDLFTPFTSMQVNCYNCVIPVILPEQEKIINYDEINRKRYMHIATLRVMLCNAKKIKDTDKIEEISTEIAKLKQDGIDHRKKEYRNAKLSNH